MPRSIGTQRPDNSTTAHIPIEPLGRPISRRQHALDAWDEVDAGYVGYVPTLPTEWTEIMGVAVPFPDVQPKGYHWLDDEPVFDPEVHLQLEAPTDIVMLTDLGYGERDIADKATPVAASAPFRVLSSEGADVLLDVARRLRPYGKPAGTRIQNSLRGGCYRSRWLRDLCTSQDVSNHLEQIYGVEIAPHPMPLHLGHMNFEPDRIETAIDKWHHDTLPLDFVLMVTDPNQVAGGAFQYFVGTKAEAAELAADGLTPPPERTVTPVFPGPGYAIALHGDMVVHRAGPLSELSERISLVNGYVAMDTTRDEQSRSIDLIAVDDHEVLWTEWAKMVAWRSHGRLGALIDDLPFTSDRDLVIAKLESAIADAARAVEEMRTVETVEAAHYGG